MVVVTASERDTVWFARNLVDIIAGGEQTNGAYAIFEMLGPPGDEVPLHLHTDEDEAFLLSEGQMTVWVGDQKRVLEQGDYALMPRNVPHCYRVSSDHQAHWLAITSPAGFEGYVREIAAPATERRLPDQVELGPEMLAKLGEIAMKYGVRFLGAPGTRPSDLAE
ncbi:MAG TPA: quercetin 2,3-dioxygenase [Amycolatopsis sp.]|uniref:quercetin 2,3-dioxygenase n=1 Tax=Amycolatopsis sp. TaxID=37632 RepID=UPI002B470379|nr:quercetin 2,3-dioxygenase [Amycolatopsis sp.]HKS49825.1 quercetin 2,3-dioxygenase [Amycolatopsis sp.]